MIHLESRRVAAAIEREQEKGASFLDALFVAAQEAKTRQDRLADLSTPPELMISGKEE